MIFKEFEPTDIVDGKTTRVASGFWPDGNTSWSASFFETNFWELSNIQTPSTAFGSSPYDVRKTLYYTDVYPSLLYKNTYKDPYFSVSYGHINGSGSFSYEVDNIKVYPTKAIYNQYKNLLLGNMDADGKFTMLSGNSEVSADDIYVINFSTYKTKDRIDEGVFEISLARPDGTGIFTFIDDSYWVGGVQSVYQLVTGSLLAKAEPQYNGIGLLYPNDGIVVFNASKLNEILSLESGFKSTVNLPTNALLNITGSDGIAYREPPSSSYFTGSKYDGMSDFGQYYALNTSDPRSNLYLNSDLGNQNNTQAFVWSVRHSQKQMVVRKSEYVPARHYFVRVKNRDFNYSNNPTYVYDGKETPPGSKTKPSAGTIRNSEFFTDPKTYITTIGLYNDTNELVAVAKLSKPVAKSFDSELLIKIRLDF